MSASVNEGSSPGDLITAIAQTRSIHPFIAKHYPKMCYVNPAALQFSTKKLYRDALRLARHLGARNGNTNVLKAQVRLKFKKHLDEADPEKIKELKKDAVRGLSSYLFYEAQRMTKRPSE